MRLRFKLDEVLCYRPEPRDRNTVRRYYAEYRRREGLPLRCDNSKCQFHHAPLLWCDQPLKPELDHIDGNALDNRPKNLRYLCPNCHRQTETYAGKNAGRVKTDHGLIQIRHESGAINSEIVAQTASLKLNRDNGSND